MDVTTTTIDGFERNRFRWGYYAFILLAVAAPLATMVTLATLWNFESVASISRDASTRLADELSATLSQDLARVASSVRALSAAMAPSAASNTSRTRDELRQFKSRQPLVARVRLVDAAGRLLADTRPGQTPLTEEELSLLEYVDGGRQTIDSAIAFDVVDAEPLVLLAQVVTQKTSRVPAGYLLVNLSPETLFSRLDGVASAARPGEFAFVSDAQGTVVWRAPPAADESNPGDFLEYTATNPLADSTWRAGIAVPAATLYASTWQMCLVLSAIAVAATLLVAVFAWSFSRYTARRVDELTVANLEREVAQRHAEEANRAKSEFLANMSHEVRTPLNGILGFTELLIRGADEGNENERQEFLRTIRDSGRQLLNLINDILDISKIEAGHFRVESSPHSPDEILSHVIASHRAAAAHKQLTLDFRWQSRIPATVQTDPQRLTQLLSNLVSNAVKFTDRGGVLVLARLEDLDGGSQLVFEVRDSGPGIPAEKLDTIFEPFVQCDASITRKHGGTGLGLAICRKIAESLGGDLTVRSVVGQGSTFTASIDPGDLYNVRMTEMPTPPITADVPQEPKQRANLKGLSILVVDDMETNRRLVSLFLTRAGASVATAENGAEGIEAIANADFDVVLMDMQMPVMDGYTAATLLREQGFQRPIIALTAHAMRGDLEKCELAGCSQFVAKPINMDELIATVKSAADAYRAAAKNSPADPDVATLPFPGSQGVA